MARTARRRTWIALAIPASLLAASGCSDDGTDTADVASPAAAGPTSPPPAATAPEATDAAPETTDAAATESPEPADDVTTITAAGDNTAASPAEAADALDLAIAELVAMPGGPPAVVAIVQVGDERTVHVGGVTDIETETEPAADDHMRIASVAKAFSGATALSLVDEGLLSLDDTIGELVPDMPSAFADVTLRQLLSHTSGLPDFIRSPAFADAVGASLDVAPPPEELLSYIADEPLDFAPGTEYAYSNSDNIAVGLMIQAVTDQAYTDVLQERVLDPLGLDQTSLPEGIEMPEPFIHGYDLTTPAPIEDVSEVLAGGWAWASGGVVSTPSDLNDFIRGYISGELYSEATREEQQALFIPGGESGPPGPGQNSASLALFRYQTPCGTVSGHTGNTVGYTQFAVATPDGDRSATVSITLQRTEGSEGQALAVFHALQRVEQAAICAALAGA